MAEPDGGRAAERTDPSNRGRLDIADRAVERIATHAAAEVPGTTPVGGTMEGVVGRQFPKADAHIAGDRVRLSVDIAVVWPHPLGQVAAAVRDAVHDRVQSLVGLQVDAVDVTTARIVHARADTTRRVQ